MSMLNVLLGVGGIAPLTVGFSGNSIAVIGTERQIGIQVSGMAYRQYNYWVESDPAEGAWCTVSNQGVFSGNSIDGSGYGIVVSGNLLQPYLVGHGVSGWVTFNLSSKIFLGSATVVSNAYVFNTSGGLLRAGVAFSGSYYGSYISLT